MNKPKFDIVAIARNEEKHIPKMMGSLKDFQDRGGNVYILDTGSTDNTVEVAKSLGCKVESVGDKFKIQIDQELADKINSKFVVEGEEPVVKAGESLFDFASARNHCVSFTEQDMVSTMDCDEVFTKLDIDKINKYIEDGYDQFEYSFVFSHDYQGNPVIKFRQSKFYDKTKVKWMGIIHEVLQGPGKIIYAEEDVIKLEHWQNMETSRTGYLKGLAVDCFNNPENDRNSHYFAREMMYCGRFKSAIKEFENHISMNRWVTEASQSMLYIGDCYRNMGDFDNMLKWYIKSFDKEARREPMMRIAEHYYKDGIYPQVIAYAEAALTVTELPFYSNHQPYYDNLPHELLYTAYWWTGKKEESKKHWEKAIKLYPNNPKYISDVQFYEEPPTIKISVVMPFKNNVKMTEECIESLIANTPDLGEIILIDDHSTEEWTAKFPMVRYYLNGDGRVNGAWNLGASLAKYDYICWCNNDLLFSPNWSKPLIDNLSNDVWVTSPYHTTGKEIPTDFPAGEDRRNNIEVTGVNLPFLGSCFMMEKKNWKLIGPIDDRIKIWCGDNYICETVANDFGRQLIEVRESYVHHFLSQSIVELPSNDVCAADLEIMKEIHKERGWDKRSKQPEKSFTAPFIDLRLKLPLKDITKMRVLNMGIGSGESGVARQLVNIKFKHLHMVDVHQPYIDDAKKLEYLADEVEFELKDGKADYNWNDYDLVMIFDVLEHIEKEESIRIVNEIQAAGVKLLVFGPLEEEPRENTFTDEQGETIGHQDHISFWTEQDFKDLKLNTTLLKNFHEEHGKFFDAVWADNYLKT